MSDVGVALDKLKISDNDDLPEYEESEIGPEDSASKISASNSSTKEAQTHLLIMAMKRIEVLEAKNDDLTEKLAAASGGSPLKRKKKEGEFNVSTWSARITTTGFFKANGGNVFNHNGARMAYVNMLMEHYKTSDFSKYTLDEIFEQDDDDDYPIFQALLNERPIPHDFDGCNLIGKNKLTSNHVKVAVVSPMAAMSMAATD